MTEVMGTKARPKKVIGPKSVVVKNVDYQILGATLFAEHKHLVPDWRQTFGNDSSLVGRTFGDARPVKRDDCKRI